MRFGAAISSVLQLEPSKSHWILFMMCLMDSEKIFEKTSASFENETQSDDNLFLTQEFLGTRSLSRPATILRAFEVIPLACTHVWDRKIMWDELDRLIYSILLQKTLRWSVFSPTPASKGDRGTDGVNPTFEWLKKYICSILCLLEAPTSSKQHQSATVIINLSNEPHL